MDISSFNIADLLLVVGAGVPIAGVGLFLAVCLLCYWLLSRRRYVILFLWPVLIYFYGPLLTSFFVGVPSLENYVFPENILAETLIMFAYFLGLIVADYAFDLSRLIRSSIYNPTVQRLASSPMFLPTYAATSLIAIVLQVDMLRQYGTVLSGSYAYWNTLGDAAATSRWGFVAGLYEIIFLCFVLFLLSGQRGKWRVVVVAIYAVTALLRVLGGTRLILVKELAFILILLFLRGNISRRLLVGAGVLTVLAGSAVGLLRAGGGAGGGLLGPLYGVAMESALNAMSFNIAYQVQVGGGIDSAHQLWQTLQFVLISVVPSFLRLGVQQADLDVLNPYLIGQATTGFDTTSPVGGMSGFATITYVTGYPLAGALLLVLLISLLLRYVPRSRLKQLAVLVFSVNAIHFWRDSIDISTKLFMQDMICALLFLYIRPALTVRASVLPPHVGQVTA
jgi:hypothetical protein